LLLEVDKAHFKVTPLEKAVMVVQVAEALLVVDILGVVVKQ
jgi:hypothetical protein